MKQVWIVEDNRIFAECYARFLRPLGVQIFSDALSAVESFNNEIPDALVLDILLDGPDGFTLLNEMASYPDTAAIPVIIVTSLTIPEAGLTAYNVKRILRKDFLEPLELRRAVFGEIFKEGPQEFFDKAFQGFSQKPSLEGSQEISHA